MRNREETYASESSRHMIGLKTGSKRQASVRRERGSRLVVGLVGPDIEHLDTGGGTAAMSLRIVDAFAKNNSVAIVPIRNYYSVSLGRRISAGLDAIWQIWRGRNRLTLVHIQVTGGRSIERDLPVAILARLLSLPVVLQFHGAGQPDDYESGSLLHRFFYRKLLSSSAVVAALGRHAEEWLQTVDPSIMTRVVNNWVDAEVS